MKKSINKKNCENFVEFFLRYKTVKKVNKIRWNINFINQKNKKTVKTLWNFFCELYNVCTQFFIKKRYENPSRFFFEGFSEDFIAFFPLINKVKKAFHKAFTIIPQSVHSFFFESQKTPYFFLLKSWWMLPK